MLSIPFVLILGAGNASLRTVTGIRIISQCLAVDHWGFDKSAVESIFARICKWMLDTAPLLVNRYPSGRSTQHINRVFH